MKTLKFFLFTFDDGTAGRLMPLTKIVFRLT
jgi:hypothetical protein